MGKGSAKGRGKGKGGKLEKPSDRADFLHFAPGSTLGPYVVESDLGVTADRWRWSSGQSIERDAHGMGGVRQESRPRKACT